MTLQQYTAVAALVHCRGVRSSSTILYGRGLAGGLGSAVAASRNARNISSMAKDGGQTSCRELRALDIREQLDGEG